MIDYSAIRTRLDNPRQLTVLPPGQIHRHWANSGEVTERWSPPDDPNDGFGRVEHQTVRWKQGSGIVMPDDLLGGATIATFPGRFALVAIGVGMSIEHSGRDVARSLIAQQAAMISAYGTVESYGVPIRGSEFREFAVCRFPAEISTLTMAVPSMIDYGVGLNVVVAMVGSRIRHCKYPMRFAATIIAHVPKMWDGVERHYQLFPATTGIQA